MKMYHRELKYDVKNGECLHILNDEEYNFTCLQQHTVKSHKTTLPVSGKNNNPAYGIWNMVNRWLVIYHQFHLVFPLLKFLFLSDQKKCSIFFSQINK